MTDRPDVVAGHRFNALGQCTLSTPNEGVCGITWRWIKDCTDETCVGMKGIAHVDAPPLNSNEIAQIRQMRAWENECCILAVRGVGTGPMPAATSNPIDVAEADG